METAERLLLTIPEAADRLRVSPRQVYILIKTAGLPTVTLGSTMRIPIGALRGWIEQQVA